MTGATDKPRDTIRTFLCVELPESLKEHIGLLQNILKPIGAQVSWVKPGNIHLTLKFLGAVSAGKMEDVAAAAQRASLATMPFELRASGAGYFPSPRSPRVLWVGLENVPVQLATLAAAVESELEAAGFERENRPFAPHLTIGRFRSNHNARVVAEQLVQTGFGPESFPVSEVVVMRSNLKPTGAVYTPMYKFSLAQLEA